MSQPQTIKLKQEWQKQALSQGTLISCVNCDRWEKETGVCSLYNSAPPAEVIVIGCDNWLDDIPF